MPPLATDAARDGKRKLASETLWAFASKGIALAGTYGLLFFLVSRLEVGEFGRWSYFFSILLILAQTSELGLNTAAKRWFAEHRDRPTLGGWIHAAWRMRVWASLLAGLITLGLAVPIARLTGRPWLAPWLFAAAPWVVLYGVVEFYKSLFEATQRLRLTALVNFSDHALRLLLCVTAWVLFGGVGPLVLALGGAALFAAGLGRFLQLRHLGPAADAPAPEAAELARYCVPVFCMSLAGFISTEIDVLMIGQLLHDDAAVAQYAVPKQLIAFLPHVSVGITMAAAPALTRMAAEGGASVLRLFRRIFLLLALLYGALAAAGLGVALWVPREWIPADYRASLAPLAGLMPYVFFNALSIYTGTLMNYRGLAGRRFLFLILTLVLNIALNRWWIPRMGILGAALASSVAMMPYFALNWLQCERMIRRTPDPQ